MVVDGAWLFVSPLAGMEDCRRSISRGGGDMEKDVRLKYPRSGVERIWRSLRATG
jgi:hypothetical protein